VSRYRERSPGGASRRLDIGSTVGEPIVEPIAPPRRASGLPCTSSQAQALAPETRVGPNDSREYAVRSKSMLRVCCVERAIAIGIPRHVHAMPNAYLPG
jgi:hypothetical protein